VYIRTIHCAAADPDAGAEAAGLRVAIPPGRKIQRDKRPKRDFTHNFSEHDAVRLGKTGGAWLGFINFGSAELLNGAALLLPH